MATTTGINIVTDNLVFSIDATNPKSYTSGSANVFNLRNTNITGSVENGLSFSFDKLGVWDFDGADDNINLGSIDSSNVLSLYNTPFTISTWLAADLTGDVYQRVIDKSDTSGGATGYTLIFPNSTTAEASLYCGSSGTVAIAYTIPGYTAGQWVNIATTKTGDDHQIYINGALAISNTVADRNVASNTTNARIGTWNHSTAREYNGKIASILIYHKVLSAEEIQQNYNALKSRFI
jgi:hypothetical protein